ncbi:hypothetical protein FRX31_006377, partial [Thalictrum thalictroides]
MFYFKFVDEEERQNVLEFGSIYIGGKLFVIRQWTKEVEMHKSKVSTLPIWIKVYHIPKELWSPKGISFIASLLGLPLCMDEKTLKRTRLEFAKICVEIPVGFDFSKSLSLDLKYRIVEKTTSVWTVKAVQPQDTTNVSVPLNSVVFAGETSCLRNDEGVAINPTPSILHLEGIPHPEPHTPANGQQPSQLAFIVVTSPEKSSASSIRSLDLQSQTPAVVLCSLTDATDLNLCQEEVDHVVSSIELVDRVPREDLMKFISKKNEFQALDEDVGSEESLENEIEVFTDHIESELVASKPEGATKKRFSNSWLIHKDIEYTLHLAWDKSYFGNPMSILYQKLRAIKASLKDWSKRICLNINAQVKAAKSKLEELQVQLHNNPRDASLVEKEKQARKDYGMLARMEEEDLRQRVDCLWLQFGDRNNSYFHNVIKEKKSRAKIWSTTDSQGAVQNDQTTVAEVFVNFFTSMMGQEEGAIDKDMLNRVPFRNTLSDADKLSLET